MITELYQRTLKELTSSNRAWMDFLKTAAFQYKYPFSDQVLIHAQRPGAVACAELEVWNEKFGRWVNKGAHGIALIRDKGGRAALTHVFDVRDTHHRDELPFRLWETRSEMCRDIAEALENTFGHLPMKATIGDAAISACKNICEDNLTDYLDNLMSSADGSLLDDYDEDNMRVRLLPLLKYSTAYAVLTRLGYKADESLDMDDLAALREFNTLRVTFRRFVCERSNERYEHMRKTKFAHLQRLRMCDIIIPKKIILSVKEDKKMSTEAMFRYKAQGKVMIPDLKLPTETNYPLGKYAMMRLEYLKKHRRGTYTTLLTQAKLNEHLHEVEEAAKEQISMTISRMAQNLGVTEQLKATDPMKWVQTMNGLKAAAEEEVLNSLIFA